MRWISWQQGCRYHTLIPYSRKYITEHRNKITKGYLIEINLLIKDM